MERLDRLSTLVSHLEVRLTPVDGGAAANLSVNHGALIWSTEASNRLPEGRRALVDLGPAAEPLRQALPARMTADLKETPTLRALAALLTEELTTPRCGGRFALDRLGELVIVAMLRAEIERGETAPGPLAGLAHPGLSRAIVALHDAPGRDWRVEDLAALAAMSRSHFIAEFHRVVGQPPMAYAKAWRMTLARNAVLAGERSSAIARRLGYSGGDAFARAFARTYGCSPSALRSAALLREAAPVASPGGARAVRRPAAAMTER